MNESLIVIFSKMAGTLSGSLLTVPMIGPGACRVRFLRFLDDGWMDLEPDRGPERTEALAEPLMPGAGMLPSCGPRPRLSAASC